MAITRRSFVALTATTAGALALPASEAEAALVPGSGKWRLFRGIYTAERAYDTMTFDIEVRGLESQWRVEGRLEHVYKLMGRIRCFVIKSPTPLTDTDVLATVFEQLVERARSHPGILGQMAAQGYTGKTYPVWLFRTSVLDYRVTSRSRLVGVAHTSEQFDALIKAGGKIGPVV